uniref:Uncharacterized protein n=1 Tax=Solanum tuberosum TaxID=4113 RepID=M1CH99_SOLTU
MERVSCNDFRSLNRNKSREKSCNYEATINQQKGNNQKLLLQVVKHKIPHQVKLATPLFPDVSLPKFCTRRETIIEMVGRPRKELSISVLEYVVSQANVYHSVK